jgi:hypothetical protein
VSERRNISPNKHSQAHAFHKAGVPHAAELSTSAKLLPKSDAQTAEAIAAIIDDKALTTSQHLALQSHVAYSMWL